MKKWKLPQLPKFPRLPKLSGKRAVEKPAPEAPPQRPLVVIHGLNMPRLQLWVLGRRLGRELGQPVHYFPYNFLVTDIPEAARRLSRWLDERRIVEFDAVTHSMGSVILRWAVNHCTMPRLRRAVMIAPPNEGAWLANQLHRRLGGVVYGMLFGQAGIQLRPGPLGLASSAGMLQGTEAGVIAGGSGDPSGISNWFGIPGDNDGTVAVEETIFPGMTDFVLVSASHSRIVFQRRTADLSATFLRTGLFRPGQKRSSHHG